LGVPARVGMLLRVPQINGGLNPSFGHPNGFLWKASKGCRFLKVVTTCPRLPVPRPFAA